MTKTSPALARAMDAAFTGMAQASSALCSMDRRGRRLANVFIERLWRSLKYEAVAFLSGEKGPTPGARFGPPGNVLLCFRAARATAAMVHVGRKARWTLG